MYKPSNGSIAYYGNEARMTTVWQEPRFSNDHINREYVFRGKESLEKSLVKNSELINVNFDWLEEELVMIEIGRCNEIVA